MASPNPSFLFEHLHHACSKRRLILRTSALRSPLLTIGRSVLLAGGNPGVWPVPLCHFFSLGADVLFAPASNAQLAPPPALCAMSLGLIVQLRFDSDSKTEPAAPSGGTPTSAIVA